MAFVRSGKDFQPHRPDRTQSIEYRLIFAVCFAVFLSAALIEKILPLRAAFGRADMHKSSTVFSSAASSARTCAAYAFMG